MNRNDILKKYDCLSGTWKLDWTDILCALYGLCANVSRAFVTLSFPSLANWRKFASSRIPITLLAMGIKGLLPLVEKACRSGHVKEFSNSTIAVDVSCFLHRSFTGCAFEVASGKRSDVYINFIRRYIDVLHQHGCHVILVFDGQSLPAKKEVNEKRGARRKANLALGELSLSSGDRASAFKYMQQATCISEDIIEHVISEFRHLKNVDIICAPYEADAQLTYLIQRNIAQAVVTEDSDLIAFGCDKILFKLSTDGNCRIYDKTLIVKCMEPALRSTFTFDVFRGLCIMTGCDYLPEGIPKVGFKKASLMFAKSKHGRSLDQLPTFLKRVPYVLNIKGLTITDQLIRDYIVAEFTFLYQIVFDPTTRRQLPLNDYPSEIPSTIKQFMSHPEYDNKPYWFAGEAMNSDRAFRWALGNRNLSCAEDKFMFDTIPGWSVYRCVRTCEPSELTSQPTSDYGSGSSMELNDDEITVVSCRNGLDNTLEDNSEISTVTIQKISTSKLEEDASAVKCVDVEPSDDVVCETQIQNHRPAGITSTRFTSSSSSIRGKIPVIKVIQTSSPTIQKQVIISSPRFGMQPTFGSRLSKSPSISPRGVKRPSQQLSPGGSCKRFSASSNSPLAEKNVNLSQVMSPLVAKKDFNTSGVVTSDQKESGAAHSPIFNKSPSFNSSNKSHIKPSRQSFKAVFSPQTPPKANSQSR